MAQITTGTACVARGAIAATAACTDDSNGLDSVDRVAGLRETVTLLYHEYHYIPSCALTKLAAGITPCSEKNCY